MRYWVNTISRDHVQAGVAGGFTQAGHGKASGLKRLNAGDGLVFYSPKTSLRDGEPLKAFTAIGLVADDRPYQVEMAPGFVPWRRGGEFASCVEAPIGPLIEELSFIKDKQRWGYVFLRLARDSMSRFRPDQGSDEGSDLDQQRRGAAAALALRVSLLVSARIARLRTAAAASLLSEILATATAAAPPAPSGLCSG